MSKLKVLLNREFVQVCRLTGEERHNPYGPSGVFCINENTKCTIYYDIDDKCIVTRERSKDFYDNYLKFLKNNKNFKIEKF